MARLYPAPGSHFVVRSSAVPLFGCSNVPREPDYEGERREKKGGRGEGYLAMQGQPQYITRLLGVPPARMAGELRSHPSNLMLVMKPKG